MYFTYKKKTFFDKKRNNNVALFFPRADEKKGLKKLHRGHMEWIIIVLMINNDPSLYVKNKNKKKTE